MVNLDTFQDTTQNPFSPKINLSSERVANTFEKHYVDFLKHKNLWCHAKDFKTLDQIRNVDCHYFWHQEDDYTLTNRGFVWVYPGKPLIKNCIAVLPEKYNQDTEVSQKTKKAVINPGLQINIMDSGAGFVVEAMSCAINNFIPVNWHYF